MKKETTGQRHPEEPFPSYPTAAFAVFADNHYFDPGLGAESPIFRDDLVRNRDIKLLKDSPEILEAALEEVSSLPVDFLLICGDLTKDGEESSHRLLARKLREFDRKGLKTFVINGNHDVNNQRARGYRGNRREQVKSISPEEFAELYQGQGYGGALERDPHSLSYLAEPVPGLWLLCLDTCCWQQGYREEGRLQPETLTWTQHLFRRARQEGKALLGMMHHGLLEHYRDNRKYYSAYVIDEHREVAAAFARGGLKVVFSGHFHSQDIATMALPGEDAFVYDVETGSLATYPCPYRLVTIDENQHMHIRTHTVKATASHPRGFPSYAFDSCYDLAEKLAVRRLRRWGMSRRDCALLAPQVVAAFQAHGLGNPEVREVPLDLTGVSLWGRFVIEKKRGLMEALWEQTPPDDNQLTIDLTKGAYW